MSGLICPNSSPTSLSVNIGKNSSGTSTLNSNYSVHICPFQIRGNGRQYTCSGIKTICREIVKEVLAEEKEMREVKSSQGKYNIGKLKDTNKKKNINFNLQSPPSSNWSHGHVNIVPKVNKTTQTETDNFKENEPKKVENPKISSDKKHVRIKQEIHECGLPMIKNLRLKVRNLKQ